MSDLPQLSPLIPPQTAPRYHDPSMTEWHKSALTSHGSDTFLELQKKTLFLENRP